MIAGRLGTFQNRHCGDRCVIVANGPSLNQTDFSLIQREISFGLNKIFLGFKRLGFYPRYYVAINPYVIAQAAKQIKALNCVKFLCGAAAKAHLPEDALTVHLNTTQPIEAFSTDITRGLNQGYTVTYAAMQIAYFMGFRRLVLVGLDHQYQFEGAPNEARPMVTDDPNHFAPNYFARGELWQNPDLEQSERSYRWAKEAFEKDGRTIIDATLNGACSVFPKMTLAEALA